MEHLAENEDRVKREHNEEARRRADERAGHAHTDRSNQNDGDDGVEDRRKDVAIFCLPEQAVRIAVDDDRLGHSLNGKIERIEERSPPEGAIRYCAAIHRR